MNKQQLIERYHVLNKRKWKLYTLITRYFEDDTKYIKALQLERKVKDQEEEIVEKLAFIVKESILKPRGEI